MNRFVIVSLLLHLLVYLVPRDKDPVRPPASADVKLKIVERKPSPPTSTKVEERVASKRTTAKPTATKPVTPVAPKSSSAPLSSTTTSTGAGRYSDFLPNSVDIGEPAADSSGADRRISIQREFQEPALVIGMRADIPLVFRKTHRQGKASARLGLFPEGIKLLSLDGDPLFRAILFESLLLKEAEIELRRLFAVTGLSELGIRYDYGVQKSLAMRTTEDNAFVRFERGTVKIEKRRIVADAMDGSIPGKGMPLPDREARRAKERDEAVHGRLRLSPAYISPLRDRWLFRG